MKKFLIGFAILLLVFVGGAAVYLFTKKPAQRLASTAKIVPSDELIERGRYLTNHVAVCLDCHSDRHQDRYGFPPKKNVLGAGSSQCWDETMGYPGFRVCSSNLTPSGLGTWNDGEIMRAIREGVDNEGQALFPVMPYNEYREMSDDDVRSIVAYLRTIAAVPRAQPERMLPFPLETVVKFMPQPLEGVVRDVPESDPISYGKYLTVIAGCRFCHTPVGDKHRPIPGEEYSGGQLFPLAGGITVVSANLTPHDSGIGKRTREQFIALFQSFRDEEVQTATVSPDANTVMPWQAFAGMKEKDLGAIYDFLRTLNPIDRVVARRTGPRRDGDRDNALDAGAAADGGEPLPSAPGKR